MESVHTLLSQLFVVLQGLKYDQGDENAIKRTSKRVRTLNCTIHFADRWILLYVLFHCWNAACSAKVPGMTYLYFFATNTS